MPVLRLASLSILAMLTACAGVKSAPPGDVAHTGTVQKAYPINKPGKDLIPGVRVDRFLGKYAGALGPKLRRAGGETTQYVVRTPTGQIMAQSDDEFEVGDCLDVVPLGDAEGPAYRLGQVQLLPSEKCSTVVATPARTAN